MLGGFRGWQAAGLPIAHQEGNIGMVLGWAGVVEDWGEGGAGMRDAGSFFFANSFF